MHMNNRKLTLGVFGFGCVGYGLYEVLQKTKGLNATIKKICVKQENKQRPIDAAHFTFDKNIILNDPEINVVVELIDDADAAFDIVKQALKNGKAVVSANKKMIAQHFEELLYLQKKFEVPLLYEAACCASIPIIRNLEEYYDNDMLISLKGIVNGSTNYILTKTTTENLSYQEALKLAQVQGYAETDATMDTGGFDAKFKLLILVAHAFGIILKPEAIFNIGIDHLGTLDLKYAKENEQKIKLIAYAFKSGNGKISCFVLPSFVQKEDKLYDVDDVYNGVILETCFTDTQFFVGKGAGAYPTASAVLSDIAALGYDYKYAYKKILQEGALAIEEEVSFKIYCRFPILYKAYYAQFFQSVAASYTNEKEGYLIGVVTLNVLKKIYANKESSLSIILIDVIAESMASIKHHEAAGNEVLQF